MRGEAVVVGAGPAGLSAALALARGGIHATLLEQRLGWSGRVCGGFVNPEGVRHLQTLGVLDAVVGAGGVRVARSRITTSGRFDRSVDVTVDGVAGLGVSRRVLEETLLDCARDAGVTIAMGTRVLGIDRQQPGWVVEARRGTVTDRIAADLAVLADGRFSLGAGSPARGRRGWFGWNATFTAVPQVPGELSMHFFPRGYFGVLTFVDGSTNVCGLTYLDDSRSQSWDERWQDVLALQPHLDRLMAGAFRVSDWRGVGPLPFSGKMRPTTGPVLAGDAAAVGDPYMGEGISRALGTGPALIKALAPIGDRPFDADDVGAAYARIWKRRYDPRLRLGAVTRQVQRRPALFLGMLRFVVGRPKLVRLLTRVFHHPATTV